MTKYIFLWNVPKDMNESVWLSRIRSESIAHWCANLGGSLFRYSWYSIQCAKFCQIFSPKMTLVVGDINIALSSYYLL
jgi:hypothetical protein